MIPARQWESNESPLHPPRNGLENLDRLRSALGLPDPSHPAFFAGLPFAGEDATAGAENELQAVVIGNRSQVDLPLTIEGSNYYQNILKRVKSGETSRRLITELERYLENHAEGVWENSWVRFPRSCLSSFSNTILEQDFLQDRANPGGPKRADLDRFLIHRQGEAMLRVPISYLLKLALSDSLGSLEGSPPAIQAVGTKLMNHFLSDNTSPETFSFHPVLLGPGAGMGRALAREGALRFFLTQLLITYANHRFQLLSSGQRAMVYFAPHPPIRQRWLNGIISDSFYRELFMSPCLSGWRNGERKHQYMILCHQVLSRSQLQILGKLKECGIVVNDLVTLPQLSNTSLANNGTHISLGSRKLTRLLRERDTAFQPEDEKYWGDLVIKIVEHFLPLFVGTYSAAPYRLDFWDFHPEKVLGFLPHELDYTHLRMIWRRWKKKANLKVFGHPITPFGPRWIDVPLSRIFRLRGDFVPDFRLLDYPVALLSTDQSPALDGRMGNDERLKWDLYDLGVFDPQMSLYLLYRNRLFPKAGFSGFEGRHYSLFYSLVEDVAEATDLQTLITALAYQYILRGEIRHAHIPDDPTVESERRQIFFGAAIGLPTFFVRQETPNHFLRKILQRMDRTRPSRRYSGYIRCYHREYRRALWEILQTEGAELIEMMNLQETLRHLRERIDDPDSHSALGKITRGILDRAGTSSPWKISGEEFNATAEAYYREDLRQRHFLECLPIVADELRNLDSHRVCSDCLYQSALQSILGDRGASEFLARSQKDLRADLMPPEDLRTLIHLLLLSIHSHIQEYELRP